MIRQPEPLLSIVNEDENIFVSQYNRKFHTTGSCFPLLVLILEDFLWIGDTVDRKICPKVRLSDERSQNLLLATQELIFHYEDLSCVTPVK